MSTKKYKYVAESTFRPNDFGTRFNSPNITMAEFSICIGANGLGEDYSKCCICGWNMASIDLAHINPQRESGEYTPDNIAPLCPNHHRLFDKGLLKSKQQAKIKSFIEQIQRKWDIVKLKEAI